MRIERALIHTTPMISEELIRHTSFSWLAHEVLRAHSGAREDIHEHGRPAAPVEHGVLTGALRRLGLTSQTTPQQRPAPREAGKGDTARQQR